MPKNSDATALACHDLANAGNGSIAAFPFAGNLYKLQFGVSRFVIRDFASVREFGGKHSLWSTALSDHF